MSLNEGARIVPFEVANSLLRAALGPDVILPTDEVSRIQLLTQDSAEKMVDTCLRGSFDFSSMAYGELSPDYPLCWDFVTIALGLILLAAWKLGLAVRPYFFRLHYTKNAIDPKTGQHKRHAILGKLMADGTVRFLEPQGVVWMAWPVDAKTLDRVKL